MKPKRQNHPTQPELYLLLPDASPEEVRAHAAQLCKELAALQQTMPGRKPGESISNQSFAKQFCAMDGSTWGRLIAELVENKVGSYRVRDFREVAAKMEGALKLLAAQAESLQRNPEASGLVRFEVHKEVTDAIKLALTQARNRLIPVIGHTGSGKSMLREVIAREFPTRVISIMASPTWKRTYSPIWRMLSAALGISKPSPIIDVMQSEVVKALGHGTHIIMIDEAQSIGGPASEAIKYILEMTNCVIVMLTTPAQWRNIEKRIWDDVDQIENRIYASIHLCQGSDKEPSKPSMPTKDVANYIASRLPQFHDLEKTEQKEIAHYVAGCGEHFGLWNKVSGLCDQVLKMASTSNPICRQSFEAAATILAVLGRK